MAVTSVNVDGASSNNDNSEHVTWNSGGVPAQTANLYVSPNPSVMADPNKITTAAAGLGRISSYSVDVNGLTVGTDYYCVGDADGVQSPDSPGYKFTTTGVPVSYAAHLVALACRKGDDNGDDDGGDDGDGNDCRKGDRLRIRVRTEKNGVPGSRLSGITVNFAVTGGAGSGTLKHTSAVSNQRGVARVVLIGGNPGDVQITASSPSADNQVVITVMVGN